MKDKKVTIAEFLEFFPEIDLPITLTEDSALAFSQHNLPFPNQVLNEYIYNLEEDYDDMTEFVPCFRIKESGNIFALVYWKASLITKEEDWNSSLMNYEYKMITFDSNGVYIDGKVIAGTTSGADKIVRAVTTINEDWIIHTVVGEHQVNSTTNINTESKAFTLELLANGEIVFSINESNKKGESLFK